MLAIAQITIRDEKDMIVSSSAPTSPSTDTIWLDTSVTPHKLKRWNGSQWVECGADVDLSNYYTKTEVNTKITQTQNMIASKADASTVSSLGQRMSAAEEKITPEVISQTVASSALYAYEKYAGRNYLLDSANELTFIGGYYQQNGGNSGFTKLLYLSDDFFSHSERLKNMYLSFDIKRTDIDASTAATVNNYFGMFLYYNSYNDSGTLTTTGRGFYMKTTNSNFAATDSDWVRIRYGPWDFSSYSPVSFAYLSVGTSSAKGMTGTVQVRNIKLELSAHTSWSAAPEDIYGLANRMTTAETKIQQNTNSLALKVSASTYNTEKVYRGTTVPTTLYTNMLWLDTSLTPNMLKRYTGSEWVVAGAEEVKSSGIYIGPNNVAITTENFLLQLLDPSNNENILMEMSANGEVGFKQLYADTIVSDSVAAAYNGPEYIDIDPSFSGTSDSYFRSLGDAVKALNNKYLPYDVGIFLPYGVGDLYEPAGTQIKGITGPGTLTIYGGDGILHSYISIRGCSARIVFSWLNMREIRPLNGSNRNPYLAELIMARMVEFNYCTLDANSTTYDSVYCNASHVVLSNSSLYNALQGLEVYKGWGYVQGCNGSCSWSMVCYAGYIIASGTVPGGSRSTGNNGQIFATGVTADYGSASAPVTPESTGYFYATTTKSYRGGWRSDTLDVIQGVYSDSGYKSSLSWNYGCMWFGTLKSTLSGKTVKSVTLTLHRETGSGAGSAKSVYLCAISNTSASGAPSIVTNYGAIGTIARNATTTFSIPTDAVQGLANGTYGGLCLYESKYNFGSSTYSACYMRMSGTDTSNEPYLTVVYS